MDKVPGSLQGPLAAIDTYSPIEPKVKGSAIKWRSSRGFKISLTLDPEEADVELVIGGDPDLTFWNFEYPAPFYLDTPGADLVLPYREGMLLPVHKDTDKKFPNVTTNYWIGVVDLEKGFGCMTILDTFADANLAKRNVMDANGAPLLAYGVEWQPELKRLGYPRKLVFHFTDKGGYVPMAKRYRQWAKDAGYFRSLEAKASELPDVRNLVGAVDIYLTKTMDLTAFGEYLKSLGIDRALIGAGAKSVSETLAPEDKDIGPHIKNLIADGFVISYYDIYTDLPEPGHWWDGSPRFKPFKYPEDVILDWKGDRQKGWWELTDKDVVYNCSVVCSVKRLEALKNYMPEHIKWFPGNSHFIDCETKVLLYECYDKTHPTTRRGDISDRLEMIRYLVKDHKKILGSEGGQVWALEKRALCRRHHECDPWLGRH